MDLRESQRRLKGFGPLPLVILLLLSLSSSWSFAQTNFPGTKLLFSLPQYSGESGRSFGETGFGYGGELQVLTEGVWLTGLVKARGLVLSGEQGFLDGATEVDASFSYIQGSLDLGFNFYPIKRRKSGFNIYFGATGSYSYHAIQLGDDAQVTSIPRTDQATSTGYATILGAELVFGSLGRRKWTGISEIAYRVESAPLLGSNFDLKSVTISFGLGW